MTKLNKGDRVRINARDSAWKGATGIVHSIVGLTINVAFDTNAKLANGASVSERYRVDGTPGYAQSWSFDAVELIGTIDVTKPLLVDSKNVVFVTETSDGNILVDTTAAGLAPKWIIFDQQGNFVRSQNGLGSALKLINKVVEKVLYQGVRGDGVIVGDGYDNAERALRYGRQAVKTTWVEGRVISVELIS